MYHLVFVSNYIEALAMINARFKIRKEGPRLEGEQGAGFLEKHRLEGPTSQMTRVLDFLFACVLLAFTLPLLLCVALAHQMGKPWSGFGEALLHRTRRTPV